MAHEESAPAPATATASASPDAGATVSTVAATTGTEGAHQRPRNRIQVSREKRPLFFFIGLAKKFLVSEDEVELSGLGLAVTTVVTVAEILKNSGHVTISKITTSLVEMDADRRGSPMPKAKIQIWIRKADKNKIGSSKSNNKDDGKKVTSAANGGAAQDNVDIDIGAKDGTDPVKVNANVNGS